MAHNIAIVAFDGVVPFDLATPIEVFGRVRLADGSAPYRVAVCAASARVRIGSNLFELRITNDLTTLSHAHSIFVPGIDNIERALPSSLLAALHRAANGKRKQKPRIASICSGAFVLARAGLLDGLHATTHWLAASELARRFPRIAHVDPNVLYVENPTANIFTSAGAAAGLDLCLHLIRQDFGASVAAQAARLSVMPLERDGGQAQFIVHAAPTDQGSLEPVMRWLEKNHAKPLSLAFLARRAAMSVRTFTRRFRDQTGTTPLQWLTNVRIRRAQLLLETTRLSVERVAADVGFGSIATFRDRFQRQVGTSPRAYRNAFSTTQ